MHMKYAMNSIEFQQNINEYIQYAYRSYRTLAIRELRTCLRLRNLLQRAAVYRLPLNTSIGAVTQHHGGGGAGGAEGVVLRPLLATPLMLAYLPGKS